MSQHTTQRELPEYLEGEEHKIDWKGYVLTGSNDNKYIMVKRLGYGSYASVWMAYKINNIKKKWESTNFYAIKIHNTDDVEEGVKEIQMYKKFKELDIPFVSSPEDEFVIARKTDTEILRHVCVVIDLMACSVYDLIEKGKYGKGFPFNTVVTITKQILESLKKLHYNNIIHSDIKPENILVSGLTEGNKKLAEDLSTKSNMKALKKYIDRVTSITETSDSEDSDDSDSEYYSDDDNDTKDDKSVLSVSSYDEFDSDDEDAAYNEIGKGKISIDKMHISDPVVNLSDLGTCLMTEDKRRKSIQTRYYKSPEVILRLGYGCESDMWALGCSIYEMLTGNILFNPDDKESQRMKYQLQLIIQKTGNIPKSMINESSQKELYFTNKCNLKGISNISEDNVWMDLFNTLHCSNHRKSLMIDLLLKLLAHDPTKRITALDALKHELFSTEDMLKN